MRMQSSWADKGVRQARAKAPDKDKHRLSAQVNRTEKLASKIKTTERMLDGSRPSTSRARNGNCG
jgi:hypothetical protein